MIINIINTFLEELTTGGPLKEPSATSAAATTSTSTPAAANGGTNSSAATAAANGSAKAQPACSSGKRHSLQLTERFYARPVDIFECFVQEGRLRAFTMSPATVEPQVGGKFSWFDGSITGEFVELEPPKRIVMKWRFSHWEDGCFSKVGLNHRVLSKQWYVVPFWCSCLLLVTQHLQQAICFACRQYAPITHQQ